MATVICPECNARIAIGDPSRKFAICPYCGAQVRVCMVADPPVHPYPYVPEKDETDSWSGTTLRFCKQHPKEVLVSLIICIALLFASVSCMSADVEKNTALLAHQRELNSLNQERVAYSHLAMDEAKIPQISGVSRKSRNLDRQRIDYRIVKRAFEDAGFTNITLVSSHNGLGYYDKYVFEITVDGVPEVPSGEWYPMDTPIVISYYTYDD